MEIKGKVHEVGKTEVVSETFKKRDLIIEYAENPTYPEYLRFEALQDKTVLLDELKPGDEVTVSFNLRGRPWTDKAGKTSYFNSLVIWRMNIDRTTAGHNTYTEPKKSDSGAYTPPDLGFGGGNGEESDLPF